MPTYNVLAAVVELIDAESEDAAKRQLIRMLSAAGFEVYDGQPVDAFESDTDLPDPAAFLALPIPTTDQNGYAQ